MLYYFSGTGNSLEVCRLLAKEMNERYCSVVNPEPCKDNAIGIVFPVYAWGMPAIIKRFIENELPKMIGEGARYFYTVVTCGDDVGYTDRLVSKSLKKNGFQLSAAFSILMPNTYISLPGFDIDSKTVSACKIADMKKAVPHIAKAIMAHECRTELTRGDSAWTKTYIIRPLFNKFLMNDARFFVNDDCIHCDKCAEYCPVGNIQMHPDTTSGKSIPVWIHHCEGCLGCYHVCPKNAIQYGKFTKGKGQKNDD